MRECHICGRLYDLPDHPAGTMIPCACAEEIVALRAALEAIIANEEAYKRGDGLSAHIARSVLGTEPEWSER